jgi:hypothetical protein
MDNTSYSDLIARIQTLETTVQQLSSAFYKNNFSGSQVFNKDIICNTRLRVPVYSSAPSIAEIGDLIAVGGKLYICTTASTSGSGSVFTEVGTQS